ncbi:uncharacterized protein FN964_003620 isoform 2-T3 [Alca torda]
MNSLVHGQAPQETHPREAAAPTAQIPAPTSTRCKLPPLPAAPSPSPARGWETPISAVVHRYQQPVPPPQGIGSEWGSTARMRSWRPASHSPTAYTGTTKDIARDITNEVLRKVFTPSQGPRQQLASPRSHAHHRAVAMTQTTDELWATNSGKARAGRPMLEPLALRGTGAASRAPEPAALGLGRDTTSGHRERAAQDDLATPVVHIKCHRNQWAGAAAGTILPAPQDKRRALAEEEGGHITIRTIWINPSVPELFQDPNAGSQEGTSWPSSLGTEGTAEEDSHLQSASPALAGLVDAEPAASALAGSPEEEGHLASLTPAAQEAAKAPASPVFSDQTPAAQPECQVPAPHSNLAQSTGAETAAKTPPVPQDTESPLAAEPQGETITDPLAPAARQHGEDMAPPMAEDHHKGASTAIVSAAVDKGEAAASVLENPPAESGTPHFAPAAHPECQAPAPHSTTAHEDALQDTAQSLVKEVAINAVLVIQSNLAQSTGVEMAVKTPAVPQDTESPLAAEPQGETITDPLAPAARQHGEDMAPPMAEDHHKGASTAIVSAAVDKGEVAASVLENPPAESSTPHFAPAAHPECQAPAPHSTTAHEDALQDTAQSLVKEVAINAVLVIQSNLAQSTGVEMAVKTPAVPQDTESPLAAEPQGEAITDPLAPAARQHGEDMAPPMAEDHHKGASTAIVSAAVDKGEVAASVLENPPAESSTPHFAPAAHPECQAPAPHSTTAHEDALQDTAQSLVKEVAINAVLVIQSNLAQSTGMRTGVPPTAGPQCTESPSAAEPRAEASTTPLAAAEDKEGDAAASPVARDPQHQVRQAHLASTGRAEATPGLHAAGDVGCSLYRAADIPSLTCLCSCSSHAGAHRAQR